MKVVLVQCTNAKQDEPARARRLYEPSAYFRKQRHYAESVGDRWFVQSAKHGLLQPNQEVEPYDMTPDDIEDVEEWAGEIADKLCGVVPSGATVEILGGAAYADPLTPVLERHGFEVHEPLRGLKIGERMETLDGMAGC